MDERTDGRMDEWMGDGIDRRIGQLLHVACILACREGNERERNEKEGDANTTGGGCVHDTRGGDWARLVESAGITLEKLSPHRITTRLALVSTHAMH